MGFKATFEGLPFSVSGPLEIADYSVSEDATPLAAGDSTGSVGTFTLSIPRPDPSAAPVVSVIHASTLLAPGGESFFIGSKVTLSDSRKGFTLGTVNAASSSDDGGMIEMSGTTRLGQLNVYGIQAQPFIGTLRDAFTYYVGLAGIDTDISVDPGIETRPVVFPGWHGELWYYLKQMAAAQDCDISLVSGVILLRPIRTRIAAPNRDTLRSRALGGGSLAQAVEVYRYDNRAITNELVYPPGGWVPEVQVLNVNAGEEEEYTLELSSSLSSIQAPTMETFVPQDYDESSVYTIVANDGLPVDPGLWSDFGGSLTVEIAPDTTHLIVRLRGAVGVPLASGEEAASNFSVALGSDFTGNRYSTLRIVGTGVAFNKQKVRIRTGVPASRTATDIGVTIDNPFISTVNDLYRAGVRAAKEFTGASYSLTGSVISVNRRGDTGQVSIPTYGQIHEELENTLGSGFTYDDLETHYTSEGLLTYRQIRQFWIDFFADPDVDQVFGNVQGARVYDRRSRRWYRVRQGRLVPGGISFESAEDDIIWRDIQDKWAGKTYGWVQARLGFYTYQQVELLGELEMN